MSEGQKERYEGVFPSNMEVISKKEGFLRFEFENAMGKWVKPFPAKGPATTTGWSGEHPLVRAVFKVD